MRCWLAALGLLAASGCRGDLSEAPPVRLRVDPLVHQPSHGPQSAAGSGVGRAPPQSIPLGQLQDNNWLYRGQRGGSFARRPPMQITEEMLRRGQSHYRVNCVPCHGPTGSGRYAPLRVRGVIKVPSLLTAALETARLGQLYRQLLDDRRSVHLLFKRLSAVERWETLSYLRVLHVAVSAPLERVPQQIARRRGWLR
ncbi:MAG: cytochrome c [Deltaproteobacteria bacterium]|nr:cytochrome c [Deltaproteobacteria bacterium]